MENWNEKLIKALQLNGKAERSQANYIRTVRILTEHCGKTPDLITEEELQEYFLHRRNVSQWAPNTMKSCYAACRFFFENVLKRDWHIFKIARAKAEQRMSTVLTIEVNCPQQLWSGSLAEIIFYSSPYAAAFSSTRFSSLRYFGLKHSFFFISVQAIIKSFAASFTLIFVPIPFSFARPTSLFVK